MASPTDTTIRTHPSGVILLRDQTTLGTEELRRRFRTGGLRRITRGVYATGEDRPRYEEYRLRAAAAGLIHSDATVTGTGAAALHGLDFLYPPGLIVDVLSPRVNGSRKSGFVRLRQHRNSHGEAEDVTAEDTARGAQEDRGNGDTLTSAGIRTTSPAHSAIEAAMIHGPRSGLVIAESALWKGKCRREDLAAALNATPNRKGRPAARFVSRFARDRSQSVGETLTTWCIWKAGLPEPLQQVDIFDEHGQWVAKVDFFWPKLGIIIEFDGEVKMSGKYGDPVTAARKRLERDTALTNLGMRILHLKWAEVFTETGIPTIRSFYGQFERFSGGYIGTWRLADLHR